MDLDLEGSIQLQPRSSSSTTLQLFGLPVGHYCLTLPRGREEPDPQMTFEVRGPTRLDFRPDAQ